MDLGTLYRDIVETSQDGIWVIDPDGRTLYANARIAEMLGWEPDELEHLTEFDALDEEGRRQFAEHLRDLARGEVHTHEVECLWVRRDGETLWVLVRETPLYDEQGEVQGYLHRVSDYTERRRLFEELVSSREMLAEAQRIAKVGSYEWDIAAGRITASDELCALYGIARETFDGSYDTFLRAVHPDDRPMVEQAVLAALEGADTFDFVARIIRNGEISWMRGRGEVFRDVAGRPVLARGTHQDITDAKEAQLALEDLVAQNTLMQVLASAANEAETLIDLLRVVQPVLLQHDDWVLARGYLPDAEHPGRLLQLHLDRDERDADAARPDLVGFETVVAERALRERGQVWDEGSRPGMPSIAFPVTLGTEVVMVIVITSDAPFERHDMIRQMVDQAAVQLSRVAERERAAKELAAARDGAMEASRQKSEFLATMSHEIRTPLNGVIGLNDLLLRTDLDPRQRQLASGAQVASRALLAVVNDILDFSKIESGKLVLENVDFEVRSVFEQVASVLAESARSKGLELVVSCAAEVPELLNGDPTRLGQVLTNLGSNAVKFTEKGRVSIRAGAGEGAAGATVLRVEVSDTGVGVDPRKREQIFDPFSQADASTTREYGGTGLGLAISKEIVSALDGEIGVESTPGEGATFWFTARFSPAGADAVGHARPAGRVSGTEQPHHAEKHDGRTPQDRPTLLVVEDNPVNRLVALGILETLGYGADTAEDGAAAVEAWKRGSYAAVLMDLQMPRMDGYAATRAIRELEHDGRRVPVLAMTAAAVEGEREKCLAAGMDDFLTKPVNPDSLDAMLRRWLCGETGCAGVVRQGAPARQGVLDRDRLDMLRDLDPGNTSYLDKAIGNFVARVPESLHAIRGATAAHDHDALRHAAHRLKGSALNLGLPVVGELAHQLELLGDAGSTTGAPPLVGDLESALAEAVAEVLGYQDIYRS